MNAADGPLGLRLVGTVTSIINDGKSWSYIPLKSTHVLFISLFPLSVNAAM